MLSWEGVARTRAHFTFQVGDVCCGEAVEDLEHIIHHCPHRSKKPLQSGLPTTPSLRLCKLLLVCACMVSCRRHPHFHRCGVGFVTDTGKRVWLRLAQQSVFRAELLAVVRAFDSKTGFTGTLLSRQSDTFGFLNRVGPKLCERLEVCPRVWLPTPVVAPEPPLELPTEVLRKAPVEVGPHERVHMVECNDFVHCLVCFRQTAKSRVNSASRI
eukprot:6491434-Amphidinium_carterae.2